MFLPENTFLSYKTKVFDVNRHQWRYKLPIDICEIVIPFPRFPL